MRWDMLAVVAIGGYLFGSIPTSRIIRRLFHGQTKASDIEVPVSGTDEKYRVTSTGAAAASMELGARGGCAIGILDMLKIALPTLAARILLQDPVYFLLVATMGMIGHDWPVFNRFKGGRGVSSVYGAMFAIDWIGAFAVAAGGLVIGLVIFRDFILAYISGLWLLIPWMWFRYDGWEYVGFAVIANIIFILAMLPDLKQYTRFKKMGKADMDTVLSTTPMGRGMQRLMDWLRLRRK